MKVFVTSGNSRPTGFIFITF